MSSKILVDLTGDAPVEAILRDGPYSPVVTAPKRFRSWKSEGARKRFRGPTNWYPGCDNEDEDEVVALDYRRDQRKGVLSFKCRDMKEKGNESSDEEEEDDTASLSSSSSSGLSSNTTESGVNTLSESSSSGNSSESSDLSDLSDADDDSVSVVSTAHSVASTAHSVASTAHSEATEEVFDPMFNLQVEVAELRQKLTCAQDEVLRLRAEKEALADMLNIQTAGGYN